MVIPCSDHGDTAFVCYWAGGGGLGTLQYSAWDHHAFQLSHHLQSWLRTGYPSKRDSKMLKTRLKKRVAFLPSLFPKRVIKTRFAIFNKVSFAVSSNLVCIVILFKIVTLIFSHRLRVCNAMYVAYRIVYRVVVSYMLRVL